MVAELGAEEMMLICMIMVFMSMAMALYGCIWARQYQIDCIFQPRRCVFLLMRDEEFHEFHLPFRLTFP